MGLKNPFWKNYSHRTTVTEPHRSIWEKLKSQNTQTGKITVIVENPSCKLSPSKATVFPVVMYGCESWTVKKADCRTDAF